MSPSSSIDNDGCHQCSLPRSASASSESLPSTQTLADPGAASDASSSNSTDNYRPVHGIPVEKPSLLNRWRCPQSVLSLAATKNWIIAGTGSGEIIVFNKETLATEWVFKGHSGSVYSLAVTPDEAFLFSGAADSLVKAWDLKQRKEVFTIYSRSDIGDVFSVVWAPSHECVFLGAQNASIQWIQLYEKESYQTTQDPSGLPSLRFDRFFDSKGPGGRVVPEQSTSRGEHTGTSLYEIPAQNIIQYAHYGYVYSLLVIKRKNQPQNTDEEYLVSGGGDGTVKIWNFKDGTVEPLYTFDTDASVFSMCCEDSFLYCGLAKGQVYMFDLDTRQNVRIDQLGEDDVMAMSLYHECLFRSANGLVHKWDSKRYHRGEWRAHEGLVLATVLSDLNGRKLLITGGNDASVCMWDVTYVVDKYPPKSLDRVLASFNSTHAIALLGCKGANLKPASQDDQQQVATFTLDHMMETLRDFVSYKTISGHDGMYVNDCRRCATFLRNLFRHFGADSSLIPVENGGNPIVYARFEGTKNAARPRSKAAPVNSPTLVAQQEAETNSKTKKTRILFYGHYDVIEADKTDDWDTDPFVMTNLDGYMYGRGVSDNKGPILAAIFAVAELVQRSELECDVVFLIEGEEESGSTGFQAAILKHQQMIGNIDWVLLSNSYWLNDETPCLNYGLRGVIKAEVQVSGERPDLHSGVYGGVYREPTFDLVNLVSKLATDGGEIVVPRFHESVRPVNAAEKQLYAAIDRRLHGASGTVSELMTRWRYPSLSIHRIAVSGPGNSTLIPQSATATLSLRIVPDQAMDVIQAALTSFLHAEFAAFGSPNALSVRITHTSEPWVGNPQNRAFEVLAAAVHAVWGVRPLFIREGGSIPAVRFLERTFGADAAQLPVGQASDGAHLSNERLRVVNFGGARAVFQKVFSELA